jgi:hypothetical protein
MFRVMIWGESAIILAIAALAFFVFQKSDNLKKSFLAKLILIGLLVMSVVIFLFSFDCVRFYFSRIFL